VTWIEAALVSVTVRVTVCPELMLFELALIATVGSAAAVVAAKTGIATKVSKNLRERNCFTGPAFLGLVRVPDSALEGEVFPGWMASNPAPGA